MERVTFLIEDTGEHVSCLLNPESLTLTRRAGLRVGRQREGRGLAGVELRDPVTGLRARLGMGRGHGGLPFRGFSPLLGHS